jgi:aryl-alcohol dehydrogenase-like predicted oxidoreductase
LDINTFDAKDIRRAMPRFEAAHFAANQKLLMPFLDIAREQHCTPAQLALAWLLTKEPGLIAIPGTQNILHLEENLAASSLRLSEAVMQKLDALINHQTVSGQRYNSQNAAEVDTENFV